jgi:uncharacterized membrane protein YphA (DoxX/SURF4 family)
VPMLLGFILSFSIIFTGSVKLASTYFMMIKAVLVLRTAYYGAKLLLIPIHKGDILVKLLSFKYELDGFYAGAFFGYLSAGLLFSGKVRTFNRILFNRDHVLYKLLIVSIGITYLYSGLSAIFFFDKSLAFFKSCGYNAPFLIFIITIELLGGIAIFFKGLRQAAVFVLMIDMAGATFTHFNNYFSRDLPDPLVNSLPSLELLAFLVSLTMISYKYKKDTPEEIL